MVKCFKDLIEDRACKLYRALPMFCQEAISKLCVTNILLVDVTGKTPIQRISKQFWDSYLGLAVIIGKGCLNSAASYSVPNKDSNNRTDNSHYDPWNAESGRCQYQFACGYESGNNSTYKGTDYP